MACKHLIKMALEVWVKSYEDLAAEHPRSMFGHDNNADAEEARRLADRIEAANSVHELRLMASDFAETAWYQTDDNGEPLDDPSELYLDAATICEYLAGKDPSRALPEEFENSLNESGFGIG